jgi:hypothetical protein
MRHFIFSRDVVLDPGGMLFECRTGAAAAADELALQLCMSRTELRNGRSWIRVRDERGTEIYRSSIDPDPPGGRPA